jgi:hypothetical protein
MTRSLRAASAAWCTAMCAALLLAPSVASAITYPFTFRATYSFTSPIVLPAERVTFTLYADGTWSNDEGNGGEWEIGGTGVRFYFIDKASATAAMPPWGAATWQGTITGNTVCNGTIAGSNGEQGTWKTRGCP